MGVEALTRVVQECKIYKTALTIVCKWATVPWPKVAGAGFFKSRLNSIGAPLKGGDTFTNPTLSIRAALMTQKWSRWMYRTEEAIMCPMGGEQDVEMHLSGKPI